MPPVSTLLAPIAALIADEAAAHIATHNTAPLKTFDREPGLAGLTALPALVVGWGAVKRTPPETNESQLGADDYTITYPAMIFLDLRDLAAATERMYPLVEQFVQLCDDWPSWPWPSWITPLDVKCASATPIEIVTDDDARPLVAYECLTEVRLLVSTP